MMDLRLRMKPHPSTPGVLQEAVVVEVGGEIDLHSAPRLREELGRAGAVSSPPPRVVVDLAGVSFIDSTGIGVLVGALKRAREAGGELAFCNAQSRVQRVFEITGLLPVMPLYASRVAAATAISARLDDAPGASSSRANASANDSNASALTSGGQPAANSPHARGGSDEVLASDSITTARDAIAPQVPGARDA